MNDPGYANTNMAAGDTGRRMLDTNRNISNVSTYDSLRKELTEVLTQIVEYLKPHCGPRSKYAMIVTGLGNADFEPNIFTKDGIKTLSYIEYASCIQSYMKNFLTYIGKRVDNIAKDGTTTSMLFAALFVLRCLKDAELEKCKLTTVQKEKIFKQLLKQLFVYLDRQVCTVDTVSAGTHICDAHTPTESEVGGIVAFMQTLSSSGGNYELAEVMKQVFEYSSPEVWEHLQMTQSTLEKDKSFEVHFQKSDYKIMSILATNQVLNTDLNTKYVDDDVVVFVYPDAIDHGMTIFDKVMDLMIGFSDEQPLAIVAKKINPVLLKKAEQLNMTRVYPITLHVAQDDNKFSRSDWELMAILAMSGTVSMLDASTASKPILKENTFIAKQIVSTGPYLEFFGMVEKEDDTQKLHPFYLDKEKFIPYTELFNSLLYVIDRAKNGHEKNQYLVNKASSILRQMTSLNAPSIVIAGSTHENLSNLAVVQDALGATMASLEHGFLAGGLFSALCAFDAYALDNQVTSKDPTDEEVFRFCIVSNILKSFKEIYSVVYETSPACICSGGCGTYINALYEKNANSDKYTSSMMDFVTQLLDGDITEKQNYPVLQPKVIYSELLERTGELLVRLLSTEKIVVPGGAFVENAMNDNT